MKKEKEFITLPPGRVLSPMKPKKPGTKICNPRAPEVDKSRVFFPIKHKGKM